jgi:formamidopyrimidine-DNA glycosylase
MPELPEVETTLRGIQPFVKSQKIIDVIVRHPSLRWPIPGNINKVLKNQVINDIQRRGKYLLFKTKLGTLILHLGMSGSLRVLNNAEPPQKHDHIDVKLANHYILRLRDPRRFGAFLWTEQDPNEHSLLKNLGPEPLNSEFTAQYLWQKLQNRKAPIKSLIMDSKMVVGVGNIYATEALFAAGIHPLLPAQNLSLEKCSVLVKEIKKILRAAIKQGGTTLKDFQHGEGKPGYFKLHLKAYGRDGLPCLKCSNPLKEIRLGQRSTVYCPKCQKLNRKTC